MLIAGCSYLADLVSRSTSTRKPRFWDPCLKNEYSVFLRSFLRITADTFLLSQGNDSELTTSVLTRLLVRALDIPVIAAGGIIDGAGIAAALALGAEAAQLAAVRLEPLKSVVVNPIRTMSVWCLAKPRRR